MEHQDTKLTSMPPRLKELNDNPYIKLGYGATVALETLVAFAKSNTAADLMWYICRVFGLPLPLKVAVALRILLLTTGGWALMSGIKEVCPKLAKAIQNK